MKKTLKLLVGALCAATLAFGFVACNKATVKSENEITSLTIEGWTYGENAKTPVATATFGTPSFTYSTEETGEYEATIPSNAGTYYVKATVAESDEYKSAEKITSFTIAKANDVIGALTAPGEPIYCGESLPASFGKVKAKSGTTLTYKYSKDGTTYVDAIAASEIVAGKYYAKAYSAGNKNYNGGESESVEITVAHKHEIKSVDGVYKNVCACGDEIELPKVKVSFILDGKEIYGEQLDVGSVITEEMVNKAKAEAVKGTDRRIISVNYENDKPILEETVQVEIIMDYGITVDGCALNATYYSASHNPYIKIDKETKAPGGFTIVHKSKLNGATISAFSKLTLTNYKSVSFAFKTDGTLKLDKIDPKEQLEVTDGKWVIFTVSMNEDGETWDIVVKDESGVVLIDAKQVTADRDGGGYVKDSLSSLLWGSRSSGYTWSITGEQSIWATEIRADRKDEIKSVTFGNKIDDVLLFDADKLALNEVVGATAEGFAASGFEKLYKSDESVKSYNNRALSDADLSAYSEVRFAVMSNWLIGAGRFNTNGECLYKWFYYTLKQTADNVWSVTITDEGGKVLAEAKNINGIKGGYVSNSIDEVLWGIGDLFRITVGTGGNADLDASLREGDLVVYCSEIRGTLKNA